MGMRNRLFLGVGCLHRGVCRAAMYMDEKRCGYRGATLVIDASVPDGDPVCKCSIYAPGQAPAGKGGE